MAARVACVACLCLFASAPVRAQEVQEATLPRADMSGCGVPVYPASAVRTNATGTTVVAFLIGPDGKVLETRIIRASGHADLDKSALRSVTLCRFKPVVSNGETKAAWVQSDFTWSPASVAN